MSWFTQYHISWVKKGSIINPIIYRKQIESLILRFIVGVVVKIVIVQSIYEVIGKQVILNLAIRRLFYRLLFQKILCYIIVIKVPSWLIQLILLLIFRSSRITIVGEENLKRIEKEKQKVIFAFWHGNYTLLLVSLRTKNAAALVHLSFRGNYIAQLASAFNYHIVQTPRAGRSILELVKVIKKGYSGFIAVDGPQGPPHKTKPGTIYIARKAGAKIVPLTIEARRGLALSRRWDNHFIPLPFNNITVFVGKSIDVEPDDSIEAKVEEVTRSLLESTNERRKGAPSRLVFL
ncbi:MAG: lysophospholipid acyltransferase family protein [bacterium]